MDWDIATFVVMMVGMTVGFIAAKTGSKVLGLVRLGLAYLETQVRIIRDRRKAKNEAPK